ncbi:type I toxin-antitoxin system Ibs family toxin [Salmonella enterica subsp. enterica]|nr:type I toxin-antitoxin system Ibs family toxin [Salmonella enterica subsp. enterica]
MMKVVIILVILLVISFQAYQDTRGRRNPPLPSLLTLSHIKNNVNPSALGLRGA